MSDIDINLDRDFVNTIVEEIIPEECEAVECSGSTENRLVYFITGDGKLQVHRRNSGDRLDLCPSEARELYLWLANSGIWSLK